MDEYFAQIEASLKIKLAAFQREAIAFVVNGFRNSHGVLLGHEWTLGKTIMSGYAMRWILDHPARQFHGQSIPELYVQHPKVLVLSKHDVLVDAWWNNMLLAMYGNDKGLRDSKVLFYHDEKIKQIAQQYSSQEEFFESKEWAGYEFVLMTYHQLLRQYSTFLYNQDQPSFYNRVFWQAGVFDECSPLKSAMVSGMPSLGTSSMFTSVWYLAQHSMVSPNCVLATYVQNDPMNLASFAAICGHYQRWGDRKFWQVLSNNKEAIVDAKKLFVIGCTREEVKKQGDYAVLNDLPPRIDHVVLCPFTPAQIRMTKDAVHYMLHERLKEEGGGAAEGKSPSQGNTYNTLADICHTICVSPLIINPKNRFLVHHIGDPEWFLPSAEEFLESSNKVAAVKDLVEKHLGQGDSFVLYTSHVVSVEMWCRLFAKYFPEIKLLIFDGSRSVKEKQHVLDMLKHPECTQRYRGLIANNRSLDVGVNLSCFNVVFTDSVDWNPSNDDQRFNRVHRGGQKRTTYIYKVMCDGVCEDSRRAFRASLKSREIMTIVDPNRYSKLHQQHFDERCSDVQHQRDIFAFSENKLESTYYDTCYVPRTEAYKCFDPDDLPQFETPFWEQWTRSKDATELLQEAFASTPTSTNSRSHSNSNSNSNGNSNNRAPTPKFATAYLKDSQRRKVAGKGFYPIETLIMARQMSGHSSPSFPLASPVSLSSRGGPSPFPYTPSPSPPKSASVELIKMIGDMMDEPEDDRYRYADLCEAWDDVLQCSKTYYHHGGK